jgi:hypothetical protein
MPGTAATVTQEFANKSEVEELRLSLNKVIDLLDDIKAKFDAHTHRGDGAQAGAYNTSPPQSDAQTVAPVTASAIATVDAYKVNVR